MLRHDLEERTTTSEDPKSREVDMLSIFLSTNSQGFGLDRIQLCRADDTNRSALFSAQPGIY